MPVKRHHSTESALGDFATACKVWLTPKSEELCVQLSDKEQEDVVDLAAADMYCLGG